MKNILILTLFGDTNYGQVLQNYALQTAIQDLGLQVETLNMPRPSSFYTRLWGKRPESIGERIKKIARYILFYRRMLARVDAFRHFRGAYLSLTKEMTQQELPPLNGKYDVFIVGSDQVWNTAFIKDDKLDAYTLQFVHSGKRAAYAASAGSSRNITPALVERISAFDYISVREHSLKERLEQSGLTNIHDVCDPVFLLERERWEQMLPIADPHEKPYVFAYFLFSKKAGQDMIQLSKAIAAERGLKICHVDRRQAGICRYEIGPIEWISHIAHAEVTALYSFHGLAFSIIFEKEFFVIHRADMEDRTRDLLAALGLSDRGFDSYEDYCARKAFIQPIDWRAVREKLAVIRENSRNALRDICNLS